MNTITTTTNLVNHVVKFDNIASRTESVLASNPLDAIDDCVFACKNIIEHKGLYFVVNQYGNGYVAKAAKGDFFGLDYKVTIVTATAVANAAFVALAAVRAERGRAFEEHVADGWYLRDIIDAPDEWLDAIAKKQPQEARALKELKELQMACAEAGRKAAKSLRALEATGESVELRTLDSQELLSFTWKDSYKGETCFRAEDDCGRTETWTLRDVCLRTNILDII